MPAIYIHIFVDKTKHIIIITNSNDYNLLIIVTRKNSS